MSIRPLCVEPHQVLRQAARPVTDFTDDLRRLVRDLIDTMQAHDGVGLAAPQIGCCVQVFVANPSRESGKELVIINPVLEAPAGQTSVVEGCLSIPNIWDRVRRAQRVCVRGWDPRGTPLAIEADGLLAIVCQHEADHLQGRLFIDRLSWLRRRRLASRPVAVRS